ncbi:MAG: DEAD/DEAH box helicase [Chloroflexi bacterium]|nr:DEAD/DEAH box helicase [Chloroflexota bacterium]
MSTPWWTENLDAEGANRTSVGRPWDLPMGEPQAPDAEQLGPVRVYRLTVPASRVRSPARLDLLPSEPSRGARWLAVDRPFGRPRQVAVADQEPVVGRGGRVELSWRLLNEPERRAGEAAEEPFGAELTDALTPGGVPLWKRLAYLLQVRTDLLLGNDGPIEWPGVLFEYQVHGTRALVERDALLLADDMGLGKTIQAIAALRILALRRRIERSLVVVPASLMSQWREALRAWAPELRVATVRGFPSERAWQWGSPAHVYLTSYETLREDFTVNPQSPPRRRVWDVVVLDEAQRIKNREAEVSRKCKQLARRRAWALTGTPLENSLDELASILEFVTPWQPDEPPLILLPSRALQERHERLQLRRRKAEVLPQLPPKIVAEVRVTLGGSQRQSYERARHDGMLELRERGAEARIENVLELITRLKQICNFCPATGQSAKLDDLSQRLATLVAEGHRALIFSQFTDRNRGVRAIAAQLRSYRPLLFTGDLSVQQRDAVVRQFRENPKHRALVLSLRAGGQGLNLQEASYVFHFDRWWNPAVERQAEDRSHRLGQSFPVHVYKYVCEDTIEEQIDEILRRKQRLFDEVVDDVTIDLRLALTGEELFGLFGLAPGRG